MTELVDSLVCGKCGQALLKIDYSGGAKVNLPTLYFCGLCKHYYREGDKGIFGKCDVCDMMFSHAFKFTKCKEHRRDRGYDKRLKRYREKYRRLRKKKEKKMK